MDLRGHVKAQQCSKSPSYKFLHQKLHLEVNLNLFLEMGPRILQDFVFLRKSAWNASSIYLC